MESDSEIPYFDCLPDHLVAKIVENVAPTDRQLNEFRQINRKFYRVVRSLLIDKFKKLRQRAISAIAAILAEFQISEDGSQIPGDGSQISGNVSRIPGDGSQISGNEFLIPGNDYRIPGNDSQSLGNGSQIPGNGSQIPENGFRIPGNGSQITREGRRLNTAKMEAKFGQNASLRLIYLLEFEEYVEIWLTNACNFFRDGLFFPNVIVLKNFFDALEILEKKWPNPEFERNLFRNLREFDQKFRGRYRNFLMEKLAKFEKENWEI